MKENEVLIPEKEEISVGKKLYLLGKLSLKQVILLSRLIVKVLISKKEKLAEFTKKTAKNKTNSEDLTAIVEALDEKDIYKLCGIILKEDDLKFLEDNLDIDNTSEIIAVLCEHNKFESVKKNIQRIQKATGKS